MLHVMKLDKKNIPQNRMTKSSYFISVMLETPGKMDDILFSKIIFWHYKTLFVRKADFSHLEVKLERTDTNVLKVSFGFQNLTFFEPTFA